MPQLHDLPIIIFFFTPVPAIELTEILPIHFFRYLADMGDIDVIPIPHHIFHLLKLGVPHLNLSLESTRQFLKLDLQGFPSGYLFPQLKEQVTLHLGRVGVHVMMAMGFLMILSDIIDHLHVLVVVSFQGLSPWEL